MTNETRSAASQKFECFRLLALMYQAQPAIVFEV
jgi:hypothetical protein